MPKAMEMIAVSATAPGATLVNFSAVTGNSLTVRRSKGARIVASNHKRQTAGQTRLRSPMMHDSTVGIYQSTPSGSRRTVIYPYGQELVSQDTLQAAGTGSATAGDIELDAYHVLYDDLDGVDARFIDTAALRRRGVSVFSKVVTVVAAGTGGYTGGTAINATEDYFKADTDYAILGVDVASTVLAAVRIVAPDWGNLGIGVPGNGTEFNLGATWFAAMSDGCKEPCIPIFNSSNRGQVLLSALADENGVSTNVQVYMVELRRTRS